MGEKLTRKHDWNTTTPSWIVSTQFVLFPSHKANLCHNCCTLQYDTIQYCCVLYNTVLYRSVQYSTVSYCTIQYCSVLYCTVLYCTVLDVRINTWASHNCVWNY